MALAISKSFTKCVYAQQCQQQQHLWVAWERLFLRWSCCFSKPGGSEVLYKAKPRTANMNIRKMEKAYLLLKWSGKQVPLPMTQWEADVFQLSSDIFISFIDTSLWYITAFSMHRSQWKYLQKNGTDIEDHRSKDFCQHLSSLIMTPGSQNPPLPAPNSKHLERKSQRKMSWAKNNQARQDHRQQILILVSQWTQGR